MSSRFQLPQYKTTSSNLVGAIITITCVKHPLCGEKATITGVDLDNGFRVTIETSEGIHNDIPLSWTNYMTIPGFNPPHDLPQLLDVNSLIDLVAVIDHIKQETEINAAHGPEEAQKRVRGGRPHSRPAL